MFWVITHGPLLVERVVHCAAALVFLESSGGGDEHTENFLNSPLASLGPAPASQRLWLGPYKARPAIAARERTLSCGTGCDKGESGIFTFVKSWPFHDFATSSIFPVSSPIFRSMDSILLFTATEIASSPSMSLRVSTCTFLSSCVQLSSAL
jgi:hypothetical protein